MSRNPAPGGAPWNTGRFENVMRKSTWLRFLPLAVLTLTLAGSWQLWRSAEESALNARRGEFNLRMQNVESRLRQRIGEYEQVLYALHGFIASQHAVQPDEFNLYMNSLNLENRLPGFKNIIFIPGGKPSFSRNNNLVWRSSNHANTGLAQLAINQFRAAWTEVRKQTDLPAMPNLVLVRANSPDSRLDYLMILPVYRTGAQHNDPIGWLAAPVVLRDMMSNLFSDVQEGLDIEIYDTATPGSPLLYRSYANSFVAPAGKSLFHATAKINLEGRTLRVDAHSLPGFDAGVDMARARLLAMASFLLSIVLGVVSATLVRDRSRAMNFAEGAKKELRHNKAFQAALQESEERYRNIFNNAQDLIYTLDTNNCFTSVSDYFCQATGYAREEILGKYVGSILKPEGLRKVLEINARKLQGDAGTSRDELDITCKDGHAITVEVNTTQFHQDGKLSGTMAIARDITSRRAMELTLMESEQKYRDLFEFAQEFALTMDMEMRITSVNRMVVDVLGYSAGELIGRHVGDFLSAASIDLAREMITTKVSGETMVTRYGVEAFTRDGRVIQAEFTTRLIYHGGKPAGVHAVGYDISERMHYEQALRDSEERYRSIFNNAQDLIFTIDLENRFTSVSDFFCQTMGYSREEAIGMSISKLLSGKDLETTRQMTASKLRGDVGATRYELDVITKDGRTVTVEMNTTLFYEGGKVAGIQGIARDITEQRKMEQELRENEMRIRQIYDNSQDFVFVIDAEQNLTFVTDSFSKMTGFTTNEIIGHPISQLMTPESLEKVSQMITAKVEGRQSFTRYEIDFIDRNGGIIPVEINSSLTCKNGKPNGSHGTGRDISERRNYEKALRDSEERYRSIFNNAQDLIFTLDLNYYLTSVSDFFCQITGYSREEALKLHVSDLITGDDLERARQMTTSKLRGEVEVTRYELNATGKHGRAITVEMNSSLFYENGKVAGVLAIARDITEQRKIEQELRENEERTRQIYNNTQDFVFATDTGLSLTSVTDSYYQMTGFTAEEVIGRPIVELMTPESAVKAQHHFAAKIEEGRPVTRYEIDLITSSGGTIPVEVNTYLAYKNGKPVGTHGTGRDITERRNYEKALRDSEEKYREFFEVTNDFAYSTDLDGNFTAANHSLLAATGYENLVGESIGKVLSPDQLALARQMTGTKLRGDANITRYELTLTARDGSQIPIELVSTLIYRDGKPCGIQGIGRDISERKRAEDLLRRSERNYRELMEQAADAILVAENAGGRYVDANQAACDLLGCTREELLRMGLIDILHPDDISDTPIKYREMWSGQVIHTRRRFKRKDGSYVPVELSARMLADGRLQALVRDISDWIERENDLRHANAMAEAANRAKSEFLANMSHEIRTPMNSVLGMARLALAHETDTRQIGYLEKILMSGEHLLGIIDDILDFSKIEAGKLLIEYTAFDIRTITESVSSLMTDKAIAKGLDFRMELDPSLPPSLRGDPLRLRQVLFNFVDNAIKFTAHGSVRVSVTREQNDGPECAVLFEVADTGIGMNAVEMAMLFRPFQQSDGTVTRKYGGTGLGLSISKRLVELMGGNTGAESVPGHGSRFWFQVSFDLAGQDNHPAALRRIGHQDTQTAIRNARILLAENNSFNQQVAREFLEIAGCQVQVACNGLEVLDMLQHEYFDCILMDVQMPQMDGLEATRRIRSHHAFAALPVIAVTANALEEERQRCLESGMNDFITKPLRPEMLYGVLAKWLSRQVKPLTMPDGKRKPVQITLPMNASMDFSVLAELVGGQQERMREMAHRFMQSVREDMDRLHAALEQRDLVQLQAMGHHIKSPAAMVGASDFAELCRALESNKDDLEKARDLVSRMTGMLDQIEAEIASHFS